MAPPADEIMPRLHTLVQICIASSLDLFQTIKCVGISPRLLTFASIGLYFLGSFAHPDIWHDDRPDASFARPRWAEKFREAGVQTGSDKTSNAHHYENIYGKYFAHDTLHPHHRTIKLLEIGLGCNMGYGECLLFNKFAWPAYRPICSNKN